MIIMVAFPQGIIGDPGLPGRDGDPGIEVLYLPIMTVMMNFRSSSLLLYLSCVPHRLIKDHKVSAENSDEVEQR